MDQIKNVKYSVLMSIYYKEDPNYFKMSIDSMLNQTVKPNEIIIVKDGPLTQQLENILEVYKHSPIIKIVELPINRGLGEALNFGMKYCKNELIARMDTDDISKSDRCEKQIRMFLEDDSLSIISSAVAEFDSNPEIVRSVKKLPVKHEAIVKYSKFRNPFNHPAVMFKKSAVEKVGGYKHFSLFEDYYLWARMIQNGAKCANSEEVLLLMRANDDLYKRRGGYKYLLKSIRFKYHLLKIGFYNIKDFMLSVSLQGILAIVPNKIRIFCYRKLLRTKPSTVEID